MDQETRKFRDELKLKLIEWLHLEGRSEEHTSELQSR